MKAVNPDTKHIHCIIHRFALASKTLPPELKATLDDLTNMVNFIKGAWTLSFHLRGYAVHKWLRTPDLHRYLIKVRL